MRIIACLVVAVLAAAPAHAQYYLDSPKGYRLSAPGRDTAYALSAADGTFSAIRDCLTFPLDGALRLQGGMSSYLEFDRGGAKLKVQEQALAPTVAAPVGRRLPPQTTYLADGQPIYLAFGTDSSQGYDEYVVVSLSGNASGVQEISRFSLGAQYCAGLYVLDLNGDGSVDIAAPYSTGASGGGVDVRTISANGRLRWFGNDELDSTLFSQHGYLNLLDADADGAWELEVGAPVLCSACGYMWRDLYTFDFDGNNWETDETRFAAYYAPQRSFYRALNDAVVKLAASPAGLQYSGSAIEAQYATQIGGQWYSLDPFMLDGGKVDKTWVSTLASLVSGWK
jgi:hypothetical protein